MRLLVTAISGNVATGILRSLAGCGYSLYGCDVSSYPSGMDLVSDWARVPYAVEAGYVPELLRICKKWDIQAILPVNESELAVLDQKRDIFLDAGIHLIMNHSFILRTCLDKYECMCALEALGVRAPKTFLPQDPIEGDTAYIVKPRSGCGSKFLKRVSGAGEAQELEAQLGSPLVVQEYLPDQSEEYTMGVFSDDKTIRCVIFRRKLTHGYTSFVELVRDDAMEAVGEAIAKAWHLNGSINVQMRKKDGYPYVFEINPRLSGTSYFRAQLGFNDSYWWCETALGRPAPDYAPSCQKAIGVRELTSKIVLIQ